jgi:micrococcal nuclease
LADGNIVRLIGIDTSELHHPSRPVEYFAAEAKDFVEQKLKDHEVKLVFGKEKHDKYGRLLAYVYLTDGIFLNAEIVKQGYGFAYTKFPFEFSDDFVKYETEARQAKLGLWNGDGLNELRWLKSQKREPFRIYDLANSKWAIEYDLTPFIVPL